MKDEGEAGSLHPSSFILHPWRLVGIATIFFTFRIFLLDARAPFFDELFSVWMARQPLGDVIPLLRHDSGPPLYYLLARFDSVVMLRWMSLLFATVQFALVLRRSVVAGLLLALYPPAALFAVDARAYALCAMFATAGVLAWEKDRGNLAAGMFALAAYSHYYGVLFFPLLLIAPKRTFKPLLLAVLLFLPGFYLAFHQPSAAFAWARETPWPVNLSFAGRYPEALFTPSPWWLVVIALALLIAKPDRFTLAAAVPFAALLVLSLAGKRVYFPMRFESVIAAPIALWIATTRWRPAALSAIGAAVLAIGVRDHLARPVDSYREAAMLLVRNAAPGETIVATGYPYLEASVAMRRNLPSFPGDQATHPGWRSTTRPDSRELPAGPFLWIGERGAPELAVLRGVRRVEPLFMNERAIVARVLP